MVVVVEIQGKHLVLFLASLKCKLFSQAKTRDFLAFRTEIHTELYYRARWYNLSR